MIIYHAAITTVADYLERTVPHRQAHLARAEDRDMATFTLIELRGAGRLGFAGFFEVGSSSNSTRTRFEKKVTPLSLSRVHRGALKARLLTLIRNKSGARERRKPGDLIPHLKSLKEKPKSNEDTRTPEELLDLIEAKGREVAEGLAALRKRKE